MATMWSEGVMKKSTWAFLHGICFMLFDLLILWFWFYLNHLGRTREWPEWTAVPMNVTLLVFMVGFVLLTVAQFINWITFKDKKQ